MLLLSGLVFFYGASYTPTNYALALLGFIGVIVAIVGMGAEQE